MERWPRQTSNRRIRVENTMVGLPDLVPPEERVAAFDQDGTLWVEHPVYSQLMFCLDLRSCYCGSKTELKNVELFKTVMSGYREATGKLTMLSLEKSRLPRSRVCHRAVSDRCEAVARHRQRPALAPALHRTDLPAHAGSSAVSASQRVQDLNSYRRRPGLRACLRRADLRDSARPGGRHRWGYDKNGKPFLTKEPKLLLNDNNAGKPEGIHLMIGRRAYVAFGNSPGDRQMLEYTKAGDGARLAMLVLHDDAKREYAYGPAQGLPDTKIGNFTQALYDEAKKQGWTVINMKNDWKPIFAFEN